MSDRAASGDQLTSDPPLDYPPYGSTRLRAPRREPVIASVVTRAPRPDAGPDLTDLTTDGAIGERVVVQGRVLAQGGRAIRGTLVEIWQANAAGRYHQGDDHDAPLDPGFVGKGRCLTDANGRYRFTTIRPGAYPWGNHHNAWRPPHIHFSVLGETVAHRLVTQMYFPGDPLLPLDPVFHSVPDAAARARLVARFDLGATVPERALGYRFDIVLPAS